MERTGVDEGDVVSPLLAAFEALDAFRRRQANGDAETSAAFLARHGDLRELLEPLLRADADGAAAVAAHPLHRLPAPGEVFGDYLVGEAIGHGGMGSVFRAYDRRLRRCVALKVIAGERLHSEAVRRRFLLEARAASQLDHPGICPIHELGDVGGVLYLAMRFVDGESLAQRIQAARARPGGPGAVDVDRMVAIVERVARAVHHAHERRVVHRDIKPQNVVVDRAGEPVVLDFGVALLLDADERLTRTGEPIGTPAYMAPEQITGAAIDHRVDVWGLGVLLYECLALQRPFAGPSEHELRQTILEQAPASLRRVSGRRIARDVAVIVDKALRKSPAHRYATALEFADDLARHLRREPIVARPASLLLRIRRWCQRYPWAAALLVLLAIISGWASRQTASSNRTSRELAASLAEVRRLSADEALQNARALTQRGEWAAAVSEYSAAERLGADPVDVQLGLVDVYEGSFEMDRAGVLLADLAARTDLGRRRARVDLRQGDPSRQPFGKKALDLRQVRSALASGDLDVADAAYAEAVLAESTGAALAALRRALAVDSSHRAANEMLLVVLLLHEGEAAAIAAANEFDRLYRRDPVAAFVEALALRLRGDAAASAQVLADPALPSVLAPRVEEFCVLARGLRDSLGAIAREARLVFVDAARNPSPLVELNALLRGLAPVVAVLLAPGPVGQQPLYVRIPPLLCQRMVRAGAAQCLPFVGAANRLAAATAGAECCPQSAFHVFRAFALAEARAPKAEIAAAFAAAKEAPDLFGLRGFARFYHAWAACIGYLGVEEDRGDDRAAARAEGLRALDDFVEAGVTDVLDLAFAAHCAVHLDDASRAAEIALRWGRADAAVPAPRVLFAEALAGLGSPAAAAEFARAALRAWPGDAALERAAAIGRGDRSSAEASASRQPAK